ncbi:YscQ/HrcQ family type III secretion apparatus protein [Prodigiosinella confusarubida]|uniref:YscQ/HrcQ family type III secretion apparatus protein n=1 Tax=Serratia sp. (strain ATCC 39006) TaxID=104623 RepID=A0A2I5T7Q5_SERS3|nr:FliM/FliN family flagellar motor switch protein [Serratia sp. ATCC 39006]AUH00605.1 YscQ/HrcQ family type III secretion apparatus protein [Serratia sp. ATCC 39006]AUH04926.1 YscQ/HrcQ family type III secretion apparatus protein [Serratia sp. ATCC 39006]
MNCQPLNLPPVRYQQALVYRRLAAGYRFAFTLDGQPGELRLNLAETASLRGTETSWHCDHGRLLLDSADTVLSLFSSCPALLPEHSSTADDAEEDTQEWYWTLYNHYLSPALRQLLGELQPTSLPAAQPDIALWLGVSLGPHQVRSRLWMVLSSLLRLLAQSGWVPQHHPLPAALCFHHPLILAEVTLPHDDILHMEPGDLILPPTQYFSPEGQGSVLLAGWRLSGQLQMDGGAPYHFIVTEREDYPMTSPFNDDENPETPMEDGISDDMPNNLDAVPLPPLSLTLTVRCGHLTMTLRELQRLDRGAILTLQHAIPGEAMLYHGEQPLACGELVDVEGRLGLKIERLMGIPDTPVVQELAS